MKTSSAPLAALRYHVSGAIARGEAKAIAGLPALSEPHPRATGQAVQVPTHPVCDEWLGIRLTNGNSIPWPQSAAQSDWDYVKSALAAHAALVAALEKQQDRLTALSASNRTEEDIRSFLVVSFAENRAALASAK